MVDWLFYILIGSILFHIVLLIVFGLMLSNKLPEEYEKLGGHKIFWFGPSTLNFMIFLLLRRYSQFDGYRVFDLYIFNFFIFTLSFVALFVVD